MFALSTTIVSSLLDSESTLSVRGCLSYSVENNHPTVDAFIGLNGTEVIRLEPSINRSFGQNVGFLHNDIISVVFRDSNGNRVENGSLIIVQKMPSFEEIRINK